MNSYTVNDFFAGVGAITIAILCAVVILAVGWSCYEVVEAAYKINHTASTLFVPNGLTLNDVVLDIGKDGRGTISPANK